MLGKVVQLQCYFPDDLSPPMWPTSTMGYVRSHPLSNSSPFSVCVCVWLFASVHVWRQEEADSLRLCIFELFLELSNSMEIGCLSSSLCVFCVRSYNQVRKVTPEAINPEITATPGLLVLPHSYQEIRPYVCLCVCVLPIAYNQRVVLSCLVKDPSSSTASAGCHIFLE